MEAVTTEPFVNAEVVAKTLGLKVERIHEYSRRQSDPIPSFTFGRQRRYRMSEVMDWCEGMRCDGANPERGRPSRSSRPRRPA